MRIGGGGGSPRITYRPVEQPSQPDAGQDVDAKGVDGADGADGQKKGEGAKEPKADKGAMDGFGKTSDQTDDINPITSQKSRITDGKEGLDGVEMKGADAAQKLPSENPGETMDLAEGFDAMDQMYDAAAGDMEAGKAAQEALGLQQMEAVEEPGEVDDVGDDLGTDPSDLSDPTNPHNPNGVNGANPGGEDLSAALKKNFSEFRMMGRTAYAMMNDAAAGGGDDEGGGDEDGGTPQV